MLEKRVGILILNFNNYYDTIECINSVKKNSYSNYEILVVDNYSSNESFEKLSISFPETEIVRTNQNLGYTGGINFGTKLLLSKEYDYLLYLNNDTVVDVDFLKRLVDALNDNKNAVIATGTILAEHDRSLIWYGGGKIINYRGLAVHLNKNQRCDIENLTSPELTQFISGCVMLIRNSAIDKIGLLDDQFFMYLDDIEFSMRVRNYGFELLYVPKSIIYHKVIGEKESSFKLYYSVRNRLLLISRSINYPQRIFARIYFVFVIIIKLIYWRINNKNFYNAAVCGLKDYFNSNFGRGNGFKFTGK